jgi:hypothetical protein
MCGVGLIILYRCVWLLREQGRLEGARATQSMHEWTNPEDLDQLSLRDRGGAIGHPILLLAGCVGTFLLLSLHDCVMYCTTTRALCSLVGHAQSGPNAPSFGLASGFYTINGPQICPVLTGFC